MNIFKKISELVLKRNLFSGLNLYLHFIYYSGECVQQYLGVFLKKSLFKTYSG